MPNLDMEYATIDDVSEYTGIEKVKLPANMQQLVRRANEMVTIAMRNNYNPAIPFHVNSARLAVCAQCHDWIERGVNPAVENNIQSYSLGDLTINYNNAVKEDRLCSLAMKYLGNAYLLYKGL